jgi:hypothetical protein
MMNSQKAPKAVIARGPSPSLRAEGEAISFLARDKLRNLAVANTLKNRDCFVAPLLAKTA